METFLDSTVRQNSIEAAIRLGLKKHFGGAVDHLNMTIYHEPVDGSAHKRRYLVLYDTVPGGTGYLKQLMRSPKPLMDILEKAYIHMKRCVCANTEKDGCYRCLFAYRNSREMTDISRQEAMELIQKVLKLRTKMKRASNLRGVASNALFDSPLEGHFVELLRREAVRLSREGIPSSLTTQIVGRKSGYRLTLGEFTWVIEPQVSLGPLDGVVVPCRADFVLRPAQRKGLQEGLLPIVIFTDGFAHHRDRLFRDFAQRMALVKSGKNRIWSLTFDDVDAALKGHSAEYANLLDVGVLPGGDKYQGIAGKLKLGKDIVGLGRKSSMDQLLHYLRERDTDNWKKLLLRS